MEEKYINKILNFSDDIIGKGEELIINREQAKGIIRELEQDYIPKAVIRLDIEKLEEQIQEVGINIENTIDEEKQYWKKERHDLSMQKYILKTLLGE